ncbi:LOW QUALITY PROTEIN: hypothetical protein BC936DRAFT_141309 [Jimgerdemannia flammicorona]|uniref:ubiquitinyl hydrolase 1 n=1 Tax=Jimgerdemannia flammicorona TaxID=994334 RepID=A0A433A2G3_9FUNG|nr:LOW QUALITY PROTEIN: hypothetical protein BC936DRAFT_141309 [Jimgerdemannia flammicorona]
MPQNLSSLTSSAISHHPLHPLLLEARRARPRQNYAQIPPRIRRPPALHARAPATNREELQEIENERANKRPAAAPGEASTATTDLDASETKVDWTQFVDPELAKDIGANVSAQYELCAVLTHVGRSADSGHYIGWAKRADNEWIKYDDEKVSIVREEDVQKLDGGGDWHMAYICLYRAMKLE